MQTKNCIEIVPLCHRSAPCCLGLAERTFGKDSPEYKAVLNFNVERRAGFLVHIRRCVVGFIVVDNRNLEHTQILSMAVCKSERRTGIGREMLQRLIRYGKRKTLAIRVNADAVETHEFLRNQGCCNRNENAATKVCFSKCHGLFDRFDKGRYKISPFRRPPL
jgi:GNAT superfamily N-acetyltransferase